MTPLMILVVVYLAYYSQRDDVKHPEDTPNDL